MKKMIIPAFAFVLAWSCSKDSTTNCGTTTVSYKGLIAPLMQSKCNTSGCHDVSTNAGGHQFTNYAGVKDAVDEGHFYNSMVNGSMPKGGQKLPDSTLSKIKSWVDACAPEN